MHEQCHDRDAHNILIIVGPWRQRRDANPTNGPIQSHPLASITDARRCAISVKSAGYNLARWWAQTRREAKS